MIYFINGKLEKAEECFRQVIGGGFLSSMHNLGTLYEIRGNKEEAVEYYKMAAKKGHKLSKKRLKRLENREV